MKLNLLAVAGALGLSPLALLVLTPVAIAAQIVIPNTTVLSSDIFEGPSLNVSNLTPADTLNINVLGTVDLAGGGFTANAAGVIVSPGFTNTGNSPGQTAPAGIEAPLPGNPFATLLLGNTDLGFAQVLPANAVNGLGSSTPPTSLFLNTTFGSLFPGLSSLSPYSGELQWRVNDTYGFDNTGSFEVRNVESESVPEPVMLPGLLGFGIGVSALLKRGKQEPAEQGA